MKDRNARIRAANQIINKVTKKPIRPGDLINTNGNKLRVLRPYKIKGLWVLRIEQTTNSAIIGAERIVSSGTIILNRIKG